jgi:membrane protein
MSLTMTVVQISRATKKALVDLNQNHLLAFAGSLAYYFFLSLLPLLVFLASLLGFIPIPNLFDQIMVLMAHIVPADSLQLVKKVLTEIMNGQNTGFLSVGFLGTIWAASGGFSAMIEALNVAYDVREGRPFWKTRSLAVALTFLVGAMVAIILASMVLGPAWGTRLLHHFGLDPVFVRTWFYLRWLIAICFAVFAVEVVYYLAPNVEQRRFSKTIPGAVVAVLLWVGASYGFGLYLQHFTNFNKSYGALGAVVALLLWFYLSSAAFLVGAEVNQELIKAARQKLPMKEVPEPMPKEPKREDLKMLS